MVLSPNDEEVANSSEKRTQFKTRVHKPYPISDQNGRIQTKTAKKTIKPFGAAHTYIAYIRDCPPGAKNALQIMSLAAYASETNKGIFAWPKLKRTFSCRNKLVYSILFLFKFRTCCTQC